MAENASSKFRGLLLAPEDIFCSTGGALAVSDCMLLSVRRLSACSLVISKPHHHSCAMAVSALTCTPVSPIPPTRTLSPASSNDLTRANARFTAGVSATSPAVMISSLVGARRCLALRGEAVGLVNSARSNELVAISPSFRSITDAMSCLFARSSTDVTLCKPACSFCNA